MISAVPVLLTRTLFTAVARCGIELYTGVRPSHTWNCPLQPFLQPHLSNCRHASVASRRVVQCIPQPLLKWTQPHSIGDGSSGVCCVFAVAWNSAITRPSLDRTPSSVAKLQNSLSGLLPFCRPSLADALFWSWAWSIATVENACVVFFIVKFPARNCANTFGCLISSVNISRRWTGIHLA